MLTNLTPVTKIERSSEWPMPPHDDVNGAFAHYLGERVAVELVESHGVGSREVFNQMISELCAQKPPLSAPQSAYFAIGATHKFNSLASERKGVLV